MTCPTCQAEMRYVTHCRVGKGPRYGEFSVYTCEYHGLVYHTREGLEDDHGDDVLTREPLKPRPTSNAGAILLPAPD